MAQFRRPASLSPQRQEAIEGGVDPALKNQAAHESAAALLRETRENARPEVVERVLRLVEREGLEDLAALWSGAEPASLPGALWRLYVLHTWVQRDTDEVRRLFELGQSTAPGLTYLVGFSDPPTIDSMRVTLDAILSGAFTGDPSVALSRAHRTRAFIRDPRDARGAHHTRRSSPQNRRGTQRGCPVSSCRHARVALNSRG